jgi:hypothetical protein
MIFLRDLFFQMVIFVVFSIFIYIQILSNFDHSKKLKKINDHILFCIVLTTTSNLDLKATIAYESWINKCDDYRFITVLPNISTNEIEYNYEYDLKSAYAINNSSKLNSITYRQKFKYIKLLQPPGYNNDSYRKLTDKIFLACKYIYKKYPNYKWYLKSDDDTFFYVDNLKRFLIGKNSSRAVTYGQVIIPTNRDELNINLMKENITGFLSGGAGFIFGNNGMIYFIF